MTEASDMFAEERYLERDARRGSAMLRDALLRSMFPPPPPVRAAPKPRTASPVTSIQRRVANYFAIPTREMRRQCRKPHLAKPRQIAMFVAHQQGLSIRHIARQFQRDRSTVLHGVRLVSADPALTFHAREILAKLRPVNSGDKSNSTLIHAAERGKEHCMNGQQELAA